MTLTLLNTSWKVDPENENKHYSDHLGGNEIWSNDESVNWGQYGSIKDNQCTSTLWSIKRNDVQEQSMIQ